MLLFWSYVPAFPCPSIKAGPEVPCYRADSLAEMQDTLKALADMRVWQEVERETVEGRDAQRITAEAA